MSDDGAYYFEDYDFAEAPYGTADDVAEHALPSPVWVSYDPDYDIESPFTDCEEYFSDEYYDEDTEAIRKGKGGSAQAAEKEVAQEEPWKKRRKLEVTRKIPELKLPEKKNFQLRPTVVWKSRAERLRLSPPRDVFVNGQGDKVALLTDWRERFKAMPTDTSSAKRTQLEMEDGNEDDATFENFKVDSLNDEESRILPPLSLTDESVPHPRRVGNAEEADYIDGAPSVQNHLPPEHELSRSPEPKRKAVMLDDEDDDKSNRKKQAKSKLNEVESAEPTGEGPKAHPRQIL